MDHKSTDVSEEFILWCQKLYQDKINKENYIPRSISNSHEDKNFSLRNLITKIFNKIQKLKKDT